MLFVFEKMKLMVVLTRRNVVQYVGLSQNTDHKKVPVESALSFSIFLKTKKLS